MSKIKKTSLCVLIIILLVLISFMVSKLFSLNFIQASTTKKGFVNVNSVYFVSAEKFSDKSLAESFATELGEVGGAGFVFEKNNMFYCLTSMYLNENDAKKVCNNLKIEYTNVEYIKLNFKAHNFSNLDNKENVEISKRISNSFNNMLNFYIEAFISLDKGETTQSKINLKSLSIISEIDDLINSLSLKASEEIIQYRVLLKTLKSNLELLTNSSNFNKNIKYLGINSAIEIFNTLNNL